MSWFGTIRQALSLSCLTMFLQQPYTVGLLLIRCHTFLNSNPILQEILFRKFGVNKLINMGVIPSTATLLSHSSSSDDVVLSLMTSRIPSSQLLINPVTGGLQPLTLSTLLVITLPLQDQGMKSQIIINGVHQRRSIHNIIDVASSH